MRIRVYQPDGSEDVMQVPEPENFGDLATMLEAAFIVPPIEHVTVFWAFDDGGEPRYLDAFVCEEGHQLRLPLNRKATEIYQNNTRVHRPSEYEPATMPYIVGTMVLFEERVWQ